MPGVDCERKDERRHEEDEDRKEEAHDDHVDEKGNGDEDENEGTDEDALRAPATKSRTCEKPRSDVVKVRRWFAEEDV